jgi:hypothetical protein
MLDARIRSRPQGREDASHGLNLPSWHTSLPRPNGRIGDVSMVSNFFFTRKGVLYAYPGATGQQTDMGTRSTLHNLQLIARCMRFATHVAFALRVIDTSKHRCSSALQEYVKGSTLSNVQPALAATCVSWLISALITVDGSSLI